MLLLLGSWYGICFIIGYHHQWNTASPGEGIIQKLQMCKILYVVKHFVAMLLLIQPLREEEPWLTVWSHAAQKVGGDKNPTEERCNRGKFLLRY